MCIMARCWHRLLSGQYLQSLFVSVVNFNRYHQVTVTLYHMSHNVE